MKTFDFYLHTKVTTWYNTRFVIEAETLEDAKSKAILFHKNDETLELSNEQLDYTIENMTPEENDNQPTEELFDNQGNSFWNNVRDNNKVYIQITAFDKNSNDNIGRTIVAKSKESFNKQVEEFEASIPYTKYYTTLVSDDVLTTEQELITEDYILD
jgi:hypothetical protein